MCCVCVCLSDVVVSRNKTVIIIITVAYTYDVGRASQDADKYYTLSDGGVCCYQRLPWYSEMWLESQPSEGLVLS